MFDADDAYLTTDRTKAALFYLAGDVLRFGARYVGVPVSSGVAVLELLDQLQVTVRGWSRNGDEIAFALAGQGFCVTDSLSVIAKLTASPGFQCLAYGLRAENQDGKV